MASGSELNYPPIGLVGTGGWWTGEGTDPGAPAVPVVVEQLPAKLRQQVMGARHAQALVLRDDSAWVATWSAAGAGIAVLLALGAGVAFFVLRMPLVVAVTASGPIDRAVIAVFVCAVAAGLAAYGYCRLAHPDAIRQGRPLRGAGRGFAVAVVVVVGALLATTPWSFPTSPVRPASTAGANLILFAHDLSRGTVAYERGRPVAYYETRQGQWFRTPVPPAGRASFLAVFEAATGTAPLTGAPQVAATAGKVQLTAFGQVERHLWVAALATVVLAALLLAGAGLRWRHGLIAPPINQRTVRMIARSYQGT